MNLTKKDLSGILKKELKLSVDISDSLVDEFFQAIKTTLRSQKNLKLSGFGSFDLGFITLGFTSFSIGSLCNLQSGFSL